MYSNPPSQVLKNHNFANSLEATLSTMWSIYWQSGVAVETWGKAYGVEGSLRSEPGVDWLVGWVSTCGSKNGGLSFGIITLNTGKWQILSYINRAQ